MLDDLVDGDLFERVIVLTDRCSLARKLDRDDVVTFRLEPRERPGGDHRDATDDLFRIAGSDLPETGDDRCSRFDPFVDDQHVPVLDERRFVRLSIFAAAVSSAVDGLLSTLLDLCLRHVETLDELIVTPATPRSGDGTDRPVRRSWGRYFSGNDDIEVRIEPIGDHPSDRNASSRDREDDVGVDVLFIQCLRKPCSGRGTIVEHS
jgi:hypothetical protein